MAEYFEREKLLNAMEKMCKRVCDYSPAQRHFMCGSCPLGSAFDLVEEFPTADVQPVKHGHWIIRDRKRYLISCSNCNWINVHGKFDYCPICGATMDGEA